jgi:tetratricopeptide (TPR) repeat protein
MKLPLAAILAALWLCGCAANHQRSATPTTVSLATTQPSASPEAFLALDQIQPKPILADLKAPATAPTSRPSLDAIELYARARGAMLDGNRYNAINLLQRAIDADPASFELHYALARAYASLNNKSDDAIKAFEAAAKIEPDHLQLQVELGREYLARQSANDAIRHLRLALQTKDYSSDDELAALADFYLARALQQKGYDRAALEQYDRLLKRLQRPSMQMRSNPELAFLATRPDALYADVGQLYEKHGQYEQALKAYQFVVERNPDDFEMRTKIVSSLLHLGRNDDAVLQAEQAVEKFRANSDSLSLLRSVFQKIGRESAMIDELKRLHKQKPDDRPILFALADTLDGAGQTEQAEKLLADALARKPQAVDIVRKRFALLDARDRTADAARILIEYLADQPDAGTELAPLWDSLLRGSRKNSLRPAALQNLQVAPGAQACKLYWVSRVAPLWSRGALSRSAIDQAVRLQPPYPPAYRAQMNLIYSRADWDDAHKRAAADELIASAQKQGKQALAEELRGMALFAQNKPSDAVKAFGEAMRLGDTSPDLRLTYAQAVRDGGDSQKFEQILWKLISDRPGYEDAYASLFRYYMVNNAGGQARKVLDTWLSAEPNSVAARLLQATIVARLGSQQEAAESLLLDLFRQNPDNAEVLMAMRSFYSASNRTPRLVERLEEERSTHPDNRVAVEQLVDIYVSQKRLPEATRVLDSARAAVDSDPDLLYYISHLYERVEQKQTTEQILQQVVGIDPRHAAANNDLGYTWADEGKNLERAEQMIRVAIQQEPDNESFLDSLGWVLYKRGEFESARKFLEQAAAPASFPDPVVLDHLGDTLYRLSDTGAATQTWTRAKQRLDTLNEAGIRRDDLVQLKLTLQQKLKLAEQKQPVTVAPTASAPTSPDQAKN